MSEYNEQEQQKKKFLIFRFGCLLFLFLITLFFLFILLIITKPRFFWHPFTDFMNTGISITENYERSVQEVEATIDQQIEAQGFGTTVVALEEDDVSVLARENFPELPLLTVLLEEDVMKLYWIVQGSIDENYLLGYVEIQKNELNELEINRLGTPRITLPRFLNESLSSAALAIFTFGDDTAEKNNLISQLVNNTVRYAIEDVQFKEGILELTLQVSVR